MVPGGPRSSRTASAASNVILLCFGFLFFLFLSVLLGGGRACFWWFFLFLFFLFFFWEWPVASCFRLGVFLAPPCGLPSLFILLVGVRIVFFLLHYSFFLSFSPFFLCLSFLISFNESGFLACACCACRIQYDGMALHCLPPLLH